MLKSAIRWSIFSVSIALLIACGGSGDSSASSDITLTGVAAYGAPYPAGSKITVKDASGKLIIDGQLITSLDGSYTLNIPATAEAPFVISVSSPDLPTIVSFLPQKSNGVANLTPITNLIAAHLSNTGNPANLVDELVGGRKISTGDVAAKTIEVKNLLAPLFQAAGVTKDPLTDAFVADGSGMDRALDALKIDVIPAANSTTILIGLKTLLSNSENPLEISYARTASNLAQASGLSSVITASELGNQLAPSGVSLKIKDWVDRMVACHAENINARVNLSNDNSASASNITSATCKALFLNSNPSAYIDNGFGVSAQEQFSGIFLDSGTDLQISNAQLEYLVKSDNTSDSTNPMNGDVVFSYRWQTKDDKNDVSVVQARIVNDKLYLTGNLSPWDVGVHPRTEKRIFTQAVMANRSYINTGYSLNANALKHGATVTYIKVTTPNGKILHLKRRIGFDTYVLVPSQNAAETTGLTGVVRLAAAYLDPTRTESPSVMDAHLFWGTNPDTGVGDWTDNQLSEIPNQGNWKFDMYDVAGGQLIDTTVRRTIARAATLQEVRAINWPQITTAGLAKIAATTPSIFGSLLINSPSSIILAGLQGEDFWSADSNTTWFPTGAHVGGGYYPNGFCSTTDTLHKWNWTDLNQDNVKDACVMESTTDIVQFKSSTRKITAICTNKGSTDKHCLDSSTFKANFASSFTRLWGFDSRRVENSLGLDSRKTVALPQ